MVLDNVAGEDQEENIEVASLVVSELNQTVVGEQNVILLKREGCITITFGNKQRSLLDEIIALLDLVDESLLRRYQKLKLFFYLFSGVLTFNFIVQSLAFQSLSVNFNDWANHALVQAFE